jgi:hypothetical protein
MSLKKLQNDFLKAFMDKKMSSQFLQHIKKNQDLSEKDQLNIYQESIREGLANALREVYPVCQKLVGENFFSGMAYQYIERTPSLSPNLFNYGDCFPIFVSDFEPAKSLPYLPDMCCLEWACHCAYYAENQPASDLQVLSHLNDHERNDVVLKLPAGKTLIASVYPIHQIWEMNQKDYPVEEDGVIYLDECDERLLVWRKEMAVTIDPLTESEWELLQAIEQKKPLGEICSLLTRNMSAEEFTQLLSHATQRGWIAGWVLAN